MVGVADCSECIDVTENKDGGVLKSILRNGDGKTTPGFDNKVYVNYVGTLLNGEEFDANDKEKPFSFKLGCGEVVSAWDLCVATMTVGEKCKVTCKPEYAYGEKGSPPKIGPNETLVFEIELLRFEENYITEDRCVVKKTIKKGLKSGSPVAGSSVRIFYRGYIGHDMYHEDEISFNLCDNGLACGIPLGLELALTKMTLHEKSIVSMSADYGYGAVGKPEWNVPVNSEISIEVFLEEFKNAKESWDLSIEEKVSIAETRKARGNSFMSESNFLFAEYFYKCAEDVLQNVWEEKEKESADPVISAVRMNLALCYIKMEKFAEAAKFSEKVLEKEPRNVKALFRKGQSLLSLRKFNGALESFDKLLEIDPSNSAAQRQKQLCMKGIKEIEAKESMIFRNAFSKIGPINTRIH